MRDNTKLIFTETPANPTLKLGDIAAISKIAKERGIPHAVEENCCSAPARRRRRAGGLPGKRSPNGRSDARDPATRDVFAAAKAAPVTGTPTERAAAFAARINARLEAAGSTKRLDEAYFFTVGHGTDPFRRLRTGPRWNVPTDVTYMVEPDFAANFDPGRERPPSSARRWSRRGRSTTTSTTSCSTCGSCPSTASTTTSSTASSPTRNGNCVDIVDLTSPSVIDYDPATGNIDFNPAANNVFGGFVGAQYFQDCLGDADILGVTWTFSDVDGALGQGRDGYRDRIYTEMFYNADFAWTLIEAPSSSAPTAPTDFESVITHEAGHAVGLGHFGGPNTNQPFKLHPNGRVFYPEAVMNPFYVGGEKRSLLKTDVAALRALYAKKTLP